MIKFIICDDKKEALEIANKSVTKAMMNYDIEYKVLNAEDIEALGLKFDIIVSNIVVDYIENLDLLLRSIHNCLNEGGLFVFSQVHPLSTAPEHKRPWLEDDFCKSIYQLYYS
jgi:2-polyprenyl-3-methyl-5-hydroxy-6-metoxy-1,4-benzoquinol methylase